MAIVYTVTINKTHIMGDQVVKDITFLATGTYTTGGDTITAASMGFDVVDIMIPVVDGAGAQTNGVALVAPNLTTQTAIKLQLFSTGSGSGVAFAEEGSGNTMTGFQFRALVYGV